MIDKNYYSLSGSFSLLGLCIATFVSIAVALLISPIYAAALYFIPFVFLNCFITFGYGVVVGLATIYGCKLGKVRSLPIACAVALLAAVLADYFGWVFWIFFAVNNIIILPSDIFLFLSSLAEAGSWSIGDSTPTGTLLYLIWIAEAIAIILLAIVVTHELFADEIFCERCQKWLPAPVRVGPLEALPEKSLTSAFLPTSLLDLQAVTTSEPVSTILELRQCPSCGLVNLLTVKAEVKSQDKRGKISSETLTLEHNLLIDSDLFKRLIGKRNDEN